MRERLPGITIQPRTEPKLFLDRLCEIARGQSVWGLSRWEKGFATKDYLLLEFEYRGRTTDVPMNLIGQFIHRFHHDQDRVRVEMRASDWGDLGLTYDSYVSKAKLLMPLLAAYNHQYGTRLRFIIQSRDALAPRLSTKVKEFYDQFISLANKSCLHSSDWARFYDFIVVSHMLRAKLTENDVAYLLVVAGFDDNHARDIASVYDHGRAILRRPRDPILADFRTRLYAEIRARHITGDRQ